MDSHARPFDLRGDAWLFTELPDELLNIVMAHYTAHLRKRMLLSSVRWLAPWMDVQHIMGFTVRELVTTTTLHVSWICTRHRASTSR